MQFSRSHAGMLAVISIFTGVIAPIGAYLGVGTPLPLTDKQWIAYVMLILLIIIFYLVSTSSWKRMRIYSYALIALIVWVFYLSLTDSLQNIRTGYILTELSWGWIFLIAGSILLFGTMIFEYESYPSVSHLPDKIIGLIGSITLSFLTLVIVMISFIWQKNHDNRNILRETFDSGSIETHSGITLSPSYEKIERLVFDRKTDSLSFRGEAKNPDIKKSKEFYLGNNKITLSDDATTIKIDGITATGKVVKAFSDDQAIVLQDGSILKFLSAYERKSYTGVSIDISQVTKDASNKTLVWVEKGEKGYLPYKNGIAVGETLFSVDHVALSPSGYDIMVKGTSLSGTLQIIKNGQVLENVREGYIRGTYVTNGSHYAYVVKNENSYRIIYDGGFIAGEFEEVREIFLERSGNSYIYFARPLGEDRYCLSTRYRGNLCGLDGYMNPRISADGGSLLFAGLKDNLWSIYRNTGIVVRDTHYSRTNIHDDYVFFDITNPRQYLFVEKNEDGSYSLRKNGKLLSGTWKDFGLDVTFGYDNKIIMTVQDDTGWRIIEF